MEHPGSSPAMRRHNLPSQPTELLGRSDDLERIRALLVGRQTRLLTITGSGGIGKTRLAVAAAEAALDDFAGGAWFVDLAAIANPDLVDSAIATTLGVRETAQATPREALVASLGAAGAMLLVLDNFEHLQAAAPSVDALLAICPELIVLVTSREPLRLRREHVVEALPLAVPDPSRRNWTAADLRELPSVALFLERATAADSAFALSDLNAGAVAELIRRLDGLPLAIEFAASRTPMMTPAALVERMDHSLSLLRWDAPDLPPRQRTLRATLDWSHDLLPPTDRDVFRRLGVFVGGFTLDAAAATAAMAELGVEPLDAIASLIGKQLVRVVSREDGEPRFGMLETVREYARERLAASGEEESTRARHMLHFLTLAEQVEQAMFTADELAWMTNAIAEQANLRSALEWAIRSGNTEAEWRMVASIWPMWATVGAWQEGTALFDATLAGSQTAEPGLLVGVLRNAGILAVWSGDLDRAIARFEEALVVARDAGLNILTPRLLVHLADAAYAQRQRDRAYRLLDELVAVARAVNDDRELAIALTLPVLFAVGALGSASARALARDELDEALALLRATGNGRFLTSMLAANARLVADVDVRAALPLLRESLVLARDQGALVVGGFAPWMAAVLLAPHIPPERIARLTMGVEMVRARAGVIGDRDFIAVYGSPEDHAVLERATSAARVVLGEAAFAALQTQARTLTFIEVIDEALALVDAVDALPLAPPKFSERELLSAREREVLALVATGRTNLQIADVLFLSPNTIKSHVTSLLNKLGADNRAQVVAIAAERGLI